MEREPAHKDLGFIFSSIRKDMLNGADFNEAFASHSQGLEPEEVYTIVRLQEILESPKGDMLDSDELIDADINDLLIDKLV